jgi:hypothetical protein
MAAVERKPITREDRDLLLGEWDLFKEDRDLLPREWGPHRRGPRPLAKGVGTSSKRIATSCKGSGDLFEEDRDLLQREWGPLRGGPRPLARGVRTSSKGIATSCKRLWVSSKSLFSPRRHRGRKARGAKDFLTRRREALRFAMLYFVIFAFRVRNGLQAKASAVNSVTLWSRD